MILLRLFQFLRYFVVQITMSIMLGVAATVSLMGLFGTSAYLIARAAMMPSIASLQIAIVGVRFFGISRSIFRYFERLATHSVSLGLISKIRVWFYQNLEPCAPARLLKYHSGDLLNRIIEDIETLEDFYPRFIAPAIIGIVVAASVGLWTGSHSPLLSRILVIGLVVSGIGIPTLIYYLARKPGRMLVEKNAEMGTLLVEFIQGMSDLVANGIAEQWAWKIDQSIQIINNNQKRLSILNGISSGLTILLSSLTIWILLIAAIPMVSNDTLDGVLLAVITMVALASFEATQPLPLATLVLEKQVRATERLFDLVSGVPEIKQNQEYEKQISGTGLLINCLSFRYENELPFVLKDVSIDLPPGKWIAIVGPNGAGKTTLLNLLLRFWDYEDGSIMLGRNEIRDYKPEDIRSIMSVISQTTYLFSASLRSNMLLSSPEAGDNEIYNALDLAGLTNWVKEAPLGLDEWIGEQGKKMSAGECQRLAIARAFLQDTPILLMDEPTAHLDPITERGILRTIHKIAKGRSLLWVTHRMAGLEIMDEIMVMDRGSIVENGGHYDLLKKRGFYAKMWEIQNKNIL